MVLGIGIDAVEIERFVSWTARSHKQLQRIFSPEEITYCLQTPVKSAERFAARFAAREALYKAFGVWQSDHTVPFLTLCKAVTIGHNHRGAPPLSINWQLIERYLQKTPRPTALASHTHTKTTATACVMLILK